MHTPTIVWALVVALGIPALGCDADGSTSDVAEDTDTTDVTDPGLGIDYTLTSGGVQPRYEPGGTGFTATPWPSDRHRTVDANGSRIDLSAFPNPENVSFITTYLDYGEEAVDGFSRNGSVYVQLSGAVDTATLPRDVTALTDDRATVQMVNVTPGSPTFGQRFPLVFQYTEGADDPYYLGPTLAMRPVYGFPLADAETYCAFVTRAVRDANGNHLEPADAFVAALDTEPSLAPLMAWLSNSPVAPHDLAAATCFTTQDATREMRAIGTVLSERPLADLADVDYVGSTAKYYEIRATYQGPNFQLGEKPYLSEGGGLRLDADGRPEAQDETIRVRLLIPRTQTMPEAGWPLVLYSHGTGGDWKSCTDATGSTILEDGLAMLCIDQPLHGDRGVGDDNFLYSFNYLNPRSGRMSFRQAAADILWQTRMIQGGRFDFTAETSGFNQVVTMNPDNIVFFGHSHGGLTGVIVLGVDPRVKGAVISGASGVLVETILRRKDPLDIAQVLASITKLKVSQLDTFHPIMTLAQTLVDATDPINYAPYWLEPVTGGNSKHVFMTEGTLDAASPAVGADAVAAAAGVPLITPVAQVSRAHELKGLAPVDMPLNQNLISTTGQLITAGLRQFDGGDHFVAFDTEAVKIWRSFLRAFRSGSDPFIQRE